MSELFSKETWEIYKNRKLSYSTIKRRDKEKKAKKRNVIRDEQELQNALFAYFVDADNTGCFTCVNEKFRLMNGFSLNKATSSKLSAGMKSSCSMPTINTQCLKDGVNRCYFTSVQINVAQTFKNLDTDFDHKLTFFEFNKGVKKILLENDSNKNFNENKKKTTHSIQWGAIEESAMHNMFEKFDLNNDGLIDFGEFVKGIRVPMCQKRLHVLNEAFNKLDYNKDGILDVNDLKSWYHNAYNLLAINTKTSVKIEELILNWMSGFNMPNEYIYKITRDRFIDYYLVISSTIINDAYFDLLIRTTYNL